MQLTRLSYSEMVGQPGEWTLSSFQLQQVNLVVGRNSTGKTRLLNVIAGLARLIASGEASSNGSFQAEFAHNGRIWEYALEIDEFAVKTETLWCGDKFFIDRSGELLWSDEDATHTRFRMRDNQIALNAKLDLIQTPYLEAFHTWANSVFHFHFGSPLGQSTVAMSAGGMHTPAEVNVKDENQTALIYRHAFERFGQKFDDAVISDMREIGFNVSAVNLQVLSGLKPQMPISGSMLGMALEEEGVGHWVEQHTMSTGMFRALAIIIHVNLSIFSDHAELILLDDIGEGLDFERSSKLIKLIVSKLKTSRTQVVMTSNDRFIMNSVDIDHWTVLSRVGNKVEAYSKFSHPVAFDDFHYSGLQNFDFFAMELFDDKKENS